MGNKRNQHTPAFKAKVALEAAREIKTLTELSSEYGVHPVVISRWKGEFLKNLSNTFIGTKNNEEKAWEKERDELYRQIGLITVERDWLKKKLSS